MKKLFVVALMVLGVGSFTACSSERVVGSSADAVSGAVEKPVIVDETKGSEKAEEAAWPRTIIDVAGNEIVLEEKPERVSLLHSVYLEYFLALGVEPTAGGGGSVGDLARVLSTYETLKPYADSLDIIDLGSARETNIEAVLESNPDVIVTFSGHGGIDEIYDQLSAIAPVVLIDYYSTWQEQLLACAEIVGAEEEADQVIEETQALLEEANEYLSTTESTVSVFRVRGGSIIGIADEAFYETFHINYPEGTTFDYPTLSIESIAQLDPDYIIFREDIETAKAFVQEQQENSVWMNLKAVKNGHVVYFDESLNAIGPFSLQLTAEKLVKEIK